MNVSARSGIVLTVCTCAGVLVSLLFLHQMSQSIRPRVPATSAVASAAAAAVAAMVPDSKTHALFRELTGIGVKEQDAAAVVETLIVNDIWTLDDVEKLSRDDYVEMRIKIGLRNRLMSQVFAHKSRKTATYDWGSGWSPASARRPPSPPYPWQSGSHPTPIDRGGYWGKP